MREARPYFFWFMISLAATSGSIIGRNPDEKEKQKKYLQGGTEEKVTFYARKNGTSNQFISRHGLLVRQPRARATILICHGFMCDKNDIKFLSFLFNDYNTFVFDFRAHGENHENQCCSLGADEAYDVIGAAEFIKKDPELSKLPLIVYGFSMGAVASIIAQSQHPQLFTAAIWDCPFDSTEKIIERSIARLKFTIFGHDIALPQCILTFLQKYAFHPYIQSLLKVSFKAIAKIDASQINTRIARVSTEQAMTKITIPTFLIICANDEKAPVESVIRLYYATRGYKRLWITNGRRHFDSFFNNPSKYIYKIRAFVTNVLDNKIAKKEQQKTIDDTIPVPLT